MVNGDQVVSSESVNNEVKSQDVNQSSASTSSYTGETKADAPEKILKQSEVDKIVGNVKRETLEKARREYELKLNMATQASQVPQSNVTQQQTYTPDNSVVPGTNQYNEDQLRRMINEEAQRQAQINAATRVAQEFVSKLESGKSKYPDFDEKVAQLNLPTIPQVVSMANGMDNTADIMYEIAANPTKFANIMVLAHTAPHLAEAEMRRLSESIKKNEEALKQPTAPEPLSQIKPSTTGTDNGSMTVKDLRKQSWLRG